MSRRHPPPNVRSMSSSHATHLLFLLLVTTFPTGDGLVGSPYWQQQRPPPNVPPDVLEQIVEAPWRGGLEPATETTEPVELEVVSGAIPTDLRGVMYRNGPGRIRVGPHRYGHWFDGDGFVTAVRIDGSESSSSSSGGGGRATFRSRFVRTERYEAQAASGGEGAASGMATRGAWTQRGDGTAVGTPLLLLFMTPTTLTPEVPLTHSLPRSPRNSWPTLCACPRTRPTRTSCASAAASWLSVRVGHPSRSTPSRSRRGASSTSTRKKKKEKEESQEERQDMKSLGAARGPPSLRPSPAPPRRSPAR